MFVLFFNSFTDIGTKIKIIEEEKIQLGEGNIHVCCCLLVLFLNVFVYFHATTLGMTGGRGGGEGVWVTIKLLEQITTKRLTFSHPPHTKV